jgi:hypothetical protein
MAKCSDLHLKSGRPAFTHDFQPRLTATESSHRFTLAANEPAFIRHRPRLADRQPTIPATEIYGCWVPQNVRFLDALSTDGRWWPECSYSLHKSKARNSDDR